MFWRLIAAPAPPRLAMKTEAFFRRNRIAGSPMHSTTSTQRRDAAASTSAPRSESAPFAEGAATSGQFRRAEATQDHTSNGDGRAAVPQRCGGFMIGSGMLGSGN